MIEISQDVVIINPSAGRGRAGQRWSSIAAQVAPDANVCITESAGDAERAAREAAGQGCERVIVVGGDGTIHEAINGILSVEDSHTALGVVPLGSGDDFAHGIILSGVGHPAPAPWRRAVTIDVGRVVAGGRSRYFCNVLGIGFSAAIARHAQRHRWLRGRPRYAMALALAMFKDFHHAPVSVSYDGGPLQETKTLLLSVSLGPREGTFVLAPNARADDGQFDVLHAGALSRWQVARYLPRIFRGDIPTEDARIEARQCHTAKVISGNRPLVAHADGEIIVGPEANCREIAVSLIPARLSVLLH
ncbi:MAG: diacylglycerol kinase family protein [Pirellulaceae bacterium]|nr:hypothetical protein [Planctomycetales bacterium]